MTRLAVSRPRFRASWRVSALACRTGVGEDRAGRPPQVLPLRARIWNLIDEVEEVHPTQAISGNHATTVVANCDRGEGRVAV